MGHAGCISLQCAAALIPLTPFSRPLLRRWEKGKKTPALLIFAPRPSRAAALVVAGTGVRAAP